MKSTEFIAPIGKGLKNNKTGEWKAWPVVIDQVKCKACGLCALYCPVNSVRCVDGKFFIDPEYCKGCGVCMYECPAKAIHFDKGEA